LSNSFKPQIFYRIDVTLTQIHFMTYTTLLLLFLLNWQYEGLIFGEIYSTGIRVQMGVFVSIFGMWSVWHNFNIKCQYQRPYKYMSALKNGVKVLRKGKIGRVSLEEVTKGDILISTVYKDVKCKTELLTYFNIGLPFSCVLSK
jgi:magnesium-transporting ATPase (P-type)